METVNKPDFTRMLHEALTHPGRLSEAYFAFHNYSVGNAWLALCECYGRELPVGPINTYKGWQKLGRQVLKGQKAIRLIMPVTSKTTVRENGEDREKTFMRFILRPNWFVLAQTEGEPVPAPPVPEWDEDRALVSLGIEIIPFAMIDGSEVIVVDDADILDGKGRNGLFQLLGHSERYAVVGMMLIKLVQAPDLASAEMGKTYWVNGAVTQPLDEVKAKAA